MVQGVSKRVVVVKPQDSNLFEQAIFILKGDPMFHNNVKADDILKEACTAAERYVKRSGGKRRLRLSPALCAAMGAAATGALWILTLFIGF